MHTDPATAEDRALNVIVDIAQERCDIGGHEHDWECALLQRSIVTVTKALSELEAAQARLDTIKKLHQPTTIPERRDLVCRGRHGIWVHWPCMEARALGAREEDSDYDAT